MTQLTDEDLQFLTRFGFDTELFESWQRGVADGSMSTAHNVIQGKLCAPAEDQVHDLPSSSSEERQRLHEIGAEAIRNGELAVVVLNGGMATRFGGVVKGVVPVVGNRSFLELKIKDCAQTAKQCGGRVPIFLMNSFATDEATREHLQQNDYYGLGRDAIQCFTQFISVRMTTTGEVFRTEDGKISPHGPGHGDFAPALRTSGFLQKFLEQGGKYVFLANVDNVGARIDPAILGHHIESRCETTCEVAPKWPGDVGGSPYLYEGKLQLVEQIRYPDDFDADIVDVFNTNTFTFDAAALDRDFDLGWYFVEKKVEGEKAIQIERLVGEMTRFLKSNFLRVKRTGKDSRFYPVKTPDDLEAGREEISAMYSGQL
ncbi:MAG: UTP--glucose-1-phosphate uridylyltransferase [Planctomycetota bacterium]